EAHYVYKYAEAARLAKSYDIAEANYTDLLYIRKKNTFPLTRFWLAQIKQMLGKYTDAIVLYETFIQNQLGNEKVGSYYLNRARREKVACEWSRDEAKPQENVAIQPMGTAVNTPNKEFAAFELGDTLFYSSMNFLKEEEVTNRPYSKVMYSVGGENGKVLEDDVNTTDQHAANLTYNVDRTIKAFTRCDYLTEYSTEIRCQIYLQRKKYNGTWSTPKALPKQIQNPQNNYTHPSIGRHDDDEQDYLYFVSDQAGGKGKLDIWVLPLLTDGSYGTAKNLSSVNTIEDDITPFFHHATQSLYYSTEGRKGFGGFDIFRTLKGKTDWLESENLGSPVNSSLGDISFSLNEAGDKGYFASNRKGSTYLEKRFESCCDDLYRVAFDNKVNLIAQTFDAGLLTQLEGVSVKLSELRQDSSLFLVDQLTNPTSNDFAFTLERGKTYQIVAEKPTYTQSITKLIVPMDAPSTIEKDLYLSPIQLDLQVLVYDLEEETPLFAATVQILEAQEDGTKQMIAEQFNETGNDFFFNLQANRNYTIHAIKEGYEPVQDLSLSTVDVQAAETFLAELYMKRISFADYLPLAIYFDNDYPDVDSKRADTDTDYAETVDDYLSRKEEYQMLFNEPLDEEEAFLTAQRYEQFFEREVKKGYEDLIQFAEALTVFLRAGNEIYLQLKGYASPRAEDRYNYNLSTRRIRSIENFFRSYEGGILMPYIYNGQLSFDPTPYGESTTYFFNDSLEDERNSIYSIGASLERRVEILQASVRVNEENSLDLGKKTMGNR
ncbi:MAG: hypothetical protein AAF847_08625, partial [Bacteroidota bacterium]